MGTEIRISVNTLCYEAIQRLYRNAVVNLIRNRMSSAFPTDSEDRIRKLFKEKEWCNIVQNAEICRSTGEISSPIKDTFDYLGVNHFYNIFEKYYEVLFETGDTPPERVKEEKSATLRWVKSIKNVRDPLSHPTDEDLSLLDAVVVIDSARRVVKKFDETTAHSIEAIIGRLEPKWFDIDELVKPGAPILQDSLPAAESIAVQFVGRVQELMALRSWFENPELKLWILAGDGGKGKTAIAYKFAVNTKYEAPRSYAAVLWLSAKRKRFREGEIVYIDDPDFTDLETAMDKILCGYGFVGDTKKSLPEKKNLVLELLDNLPALLVVDDVDSLEGSDEAAITFFIQDVVKTPSKVLFTTRRSLFGYNTVTTLVQGFNRNDGIKFIQSRIELFNLSPKDFAQSSIDEILRITDASPLYIEEILRFCCTGVTLDEALRTWEEKGGEIARGFSLQREYELLGQDARKVLLAFCLSKGPSTLEDAEVISGVKEAQRVVGELQRLFLIPKPTIIEGVPRFDVNLNTRALVLRVMSGTDVYSRLETNVRRLAGELQITGKRRFEVSQYIKQAASLVRLERFVEAESTLQEALGKYKDDPDILSQLGKTYGRWKPQARTTDAKECFKRAAQLKCCQEDMYYVWWGLECKEMEWSAAIKAAEAGLKVFPENWKFKYYAGYAHSRLGRQLKMQLLSDRARRELQRAKDLLLEALDSVDLASADLSEYHLHSDILRSLVLNCEAWGDTNGMVTFLKQWQKEHEQDEALAYECTRLERKYPHLAKRFN